MKNLVVGAALVLFAVTTPASARGATTSVQVRSNVFSPADIAVARGAAVTWTLTEGKHTVSSDTPGRFDSGTMDSVGNTFTFHTPSTDVTIYYHCKIHGLAGDGKRWGSGMVGRIIVGAGSPGAMSSSDIAVRHVPSKRWPSLSRALTGLEPDGRYRIDLAPGTYLSRDVTSASLGFREAPNPRFELTIRGAGKWKSDVVFRGGDNGLGLSVDGLHVEHVTFIGQRFAGLFIRGIDRWAVDDVVVRRPGRYGVWVESAPHGRLRHVSVSGAHIAGIAVHRCSECDLLIDGVTIDHSLQGLSAVGSGTLVIRASLFRDNGVGVAIKPSISDGSLHRGAYVYGNTFRDNTNRTITRPALGPEQDLPVGSGIWIDGGAFDVVERNAFIGHSFGIVLTGPTYESRVERNSLTRSLEADVAWDGLGANVCFSHNVTTRGRSATAMPALAQELYGCDLPATVGVPYPLVTATVMGWGLGVFGPSAFPPTERR